MKPALNDVHAILVNLINETMCFIDLARPASRPLKTLRFRFTNPRKGMLMDVFLQVVIKDYSDIMPILSVRSSISFFLFKILHKQTRLTENRHECAIWNFTFCRRYNDGKTCKPKLLVAACLVNLDKTMRIKHSYDVPR